MKPPNWFNKTMSPRGNPFNRPIGIVEVDNSESKSSYREGGISNNAVVTLKNDIPEEHLRVIQRSFERVWVAGDEIWFYTSSSTSWVALAGSAGYILLRGDKVVARTVLYIS